MHPGAHNLHVPPRDAENFVLWDRFSQRKRKRRQTLDRDNRSDATPHLCDSNHHM